MCDGKNICLRHIIIITFWAKRSNVFELLLYLYQIEQNRKNLRRKSYICCDYILYYLEIGDVCK